VDVARAREEICWLTFWLSGLKRRDVSRGLTLVTGDFFNSMPKDGEIAHYRLQLLQ
jgi:hypothetical protein